MTLAGRRRFAADAAAWPPPTTGSPMKWAEVDVAALRANVATLKRHVGPGVALMAMIKANGYGHGAGLAAEAAVAGGATWLGVSSAEEALQVRAAGHGVEVLTVGWSHPTQLGALVAAGVQMAAYDPGGIAAIAAAAKELRRTARVHIKVDSGMGRLGARPEAIPDLVAALRRTGGAVALGGIFTHFADADGADIAFTEEQHRMFLTCVERLGGAQPGILLHCANSAATLRLPHMHHDMVRPGIAIYGYPPPECRNVVPLLPAMTMKACVTQVKTVRRGDTVGYGRTWIAEHDTRVATLAAGYADGVQRAQSSRGTALVGGRRCAFIGRVSMDQVSLDVSAVPAVVPGDEAVLFGRQGDAWLGADEVGAAAGTISYEVLCAVSARVPRLIAV